MKLKELQLLILQGENDRQDFKKTITHPDKIARTLVSFANTRGGTILVGVQDNGDICGADPEEEKYTLLMAATTFCEPPVQLDFEEVEAEGKIVLLVTVPESLDKPHAAKVKEGDWRSYIRVQDTSVQTSKLVERSMQYENPQAEPQPFENHELLLIDYLLKNKRITQKQYMKLANISQQRSKRSLVKLVLQGKLRLHDKNKEDYYTLS